MPETETHDHKTPNGGVKSRIVYFKDGTVADKTIADSAVITEYDRQDREIHRTYMVLRNSTARKQNNVTK